MSENTKNTNTAPEQAQKPLRVTVDDGGVRVPIENKLGEEIGVFYFRPTDMGMIEVTDKGFKLLETAPGVTVEEIVAATDAPLIIPDHLKSMADVSEAEIAKGSLPLDDETIVKETI